ncbi:MAG: 2-dehydro-3-deoxygalactonokinase [Paracoccaceae bacterium]
MSFPDWIAVDWGTTNLRVWAMSNDGSELHHRISDAGMSNLEQDEFEPELSALIGDWLGEIPMPVICCGMVGARQGWLEAPYRTTPCSPFASEGLIPVPTSDPRLQVHILAGIQQKKPADVMRGEETQIAGLLAGNPGFDGVACLPGTHTKWVHISAGEIVSFQTFMTGEMFSLLAGQSVLRHCVDTDSWDDAAFLEAANDAISSPEMFAARLFSLRAQSLIADLPAASARARLSGLLIGLELAASKPYWLGQAVAVIGAGHLAKIYGQALGAQGVTPDSFNVKQVTVAGLTLAKGQIT